LETQKAHSEEEECLHHECEDAEPHGQLVLEATAVQPLQQEAGDRLVEAAEAAELEPQHDGALLIVAAVADVEEAAVVETTACDSAVLSGNSTEEDDIQEELEVQEVHNVDDVAPVPGTSQDASDAAAAASPWVQVVQQQHLLAAPEAEAQVPEAHRLIGLREN
jgi:hypothetical protein